MKRKQRADVLSAFPGFAKMMLLLALLLWGGVQAKASSDSILQQSERTISGLVTDESGEPLIGVTVMVKGTRVGTTTNLDGVFTLKIPTNAGILQFSYMGMKTTELMTATMPPQLLPSLRAVLRHVCGRLWRHWSRAVIYWIWNPFEKRYVNFC